MKLVFIFGSPAVGKMTVGQELMTITDLRLFHNHMTIEPVIEIFGAYDKMAIRRLREVIFEEFARTNNYGMIFTYMWAYNVPSDAEFVAHIKEIFKERNKDTEFYYVELIASKEIRLQRNVTDNRLKNKLSKRDIEFSNKALLIDDKKYRCESFDNEIKFDNYIKIDNSYIEPDVVAKKIKDIFNL